MTTYRSMTIVGLASVTALLLSAAPLAQGDGMTPLHLAAERGDHELAVSLLKAGADPAAVTRIGRYTPLHVRRKRRSPPGRTGARRREGGRRRADHHRCGAAPLRRRLRQSPSPSVPSPPAPSPSTETECRPPTVRRGRGLSRPSA